MAEDGVTFSLDTSQFGAAVKALAESQVKHLDTAIARMVVLEWLRLVILKWPVDTGRSRAGWTAGAKWAGMTVPRPTSTTRSSEEIAAAMVEGASSSGLEVTHTAGGLLVEITNAVEYAPDLEDGSSLQAPLGAVEISKREVVQGKVPAEVGAMYQKLWSLLGLQGDKAQIRAQDVKRAMAEAGYTGASLREELGL